MKNPSSSPLYSPSFSNEENNDNDDDEENGKNADEKESGSEKDENGGKNEMRMRITMGLHLEKIAVRRVEIQLEKYHYHHKYHTLYFSSRPLWCLSLNGGGTPICRTHIIMA